MASEFSVTAQVSKDGKIVFDDPGRWITLLLAHADKAITVSVEERKPARSGRANRYYWGAVVTFFQDAWSRARRTSLGLPPYSKDDVHDVLVQALVGSEDGPIPGTRVRKPTHNMKSPEFFKFVEAARELALHDYGVEIETPENWKSEGVEHDSE